MNMETNRRQKIGLAIGTIAGVATLGGVAWAVTDPGPEQVEVISVGQNTPETTTTTEPVTTTTEATTTTVEIVETTTTTTATVAPAPVPTTEAPAPATQSEPTPTTEAPAPPATEAPVTTTTEPQEIHPDRPNPPQSTCPFEWEHAIEPGLSGAEYCDALFAAALADYQQRLEAWQAETGLP